VNRRTLLTGLASGPVVLAGCLGASGDGSDPEDTSGGASEGSPFADGELEDPPREFVATLERPQYTLSAATQHPEVGRAPEPIDDLPDDAQNAIRTAVVEGSFETDAVGEDLAAGFRGTDHVRVDGTVHRVAHGLPVDVLGATEVPASEADPDRTIGLYDERLRTRGPDDGVTATAVRTVVTREGPTHETYRTPSLTDHLSEFIDAHDYVAYPDTGENGPDPEGYVELTLEREDPGAPYEVTTTPISPEERFGAAVTDLESLPDAVQDPLRALARERTQFRHEVPNALREAVRRDGYVRIVDDVFDLSISETDHDRLPLEVALSGVSTDGAGDDADEGRVGEVTVRIRNAGDDAIAVRSGAPRPLGVLGTTRVRSEDEDVSEAESESQGLLWTDAYESSQHVSIQDGSLSVNSIGLAFDLGPGDERTETYAVSRETPHPLLDDRWGFDPGEYVLEESVTFERGRSGDPERYPVRLRIGVPAA